MTEANHRFLLSITEDGERTPEIIQSPSSCASCPCRCHPPSSISCSRVHRNSPPRQSVQCSTITLKVRKVFLGLNRTSCISICSCRLLSYTAMHTKAIVRTGTETLLFYRSLRNETRKTSKLWSSVLTSAFLRASMAFISIICCLRLSRSY